MSACTPGRLQFMRMIPMTCDHWCLMKRSKKDNHVISILQSSTNHSPSYAHCSSLDGPLNHFQPREPLSFFHNMQRFLDVFFVVNSWNTRSLTNFPALQVVTPALVLPHMDASCSHPSKAKRRNPHVEGPPLSLHPPNREPVL